MFETGDIIISLAGRDAGRLSVVIGIFDENHILTADGKSRKSDAPKKKKVRHIKLIKKSGDGTGFILKDGKITNAVLRKIISEYLNTVTIS